MLLGLQIHTIHLIVLSIPVIFLDMICFRVQFVLITEGDPQTQHLVGMVWRIVIRSKQSL